MKKQNPRKSMQQLHPSQLRVSSLILLLLLQLLSLLLYHPIISAKDTPSSEPHSRYKYYDQNTKNSCRINPSHIMTNTKIAFTDDIPQCQNDNDYKHIVIIGAGMAGLTAAQTLLQTQKEYQQKNQQVLTKLPLIKVKIVEANNYIGGRIKGDDTFIPPSSSTISTSSTQQQQHQYQHVIQAGAEIIHGQNTMLTRLIEKYYNNTSAIHDNIPYDEFKQEYFILSHADGGPDAGPTKEKGMYGMYYVNGELMMYDDERLRPLEEILSTLHVEDDEDDADDTEGDFKKYKIQYDDTRSMNDILLQKHVQDQSKIIHLPPHLIKLAKASYGNTVGSNNLSEISIKLLMEFEEYWQENEEEGDALLTTKVGLSGIVNELYKELKRDYIEEDKVLNVELNWKVVNIVDDCNEGENNSQSISIIGENGIIHADYVIVTTPPPLWPTFMEKILPQTKLDAIKHIGMNRAVKIAIKLKKRFWPEKLQSIIMADDECPIPEIWFDDFDDLYYVAVGFITSEAADELERLTSGFDKDRIIEIFGLQMEKAFGTTVDEVKLNHIDSRVYQWDHAYMFPKLGCTKDHLKELARPLHNVHFAGEATNNNAPCTVQAAMETGEREAKAILLKLY